MQGIDFVVDEKGHKKAAVVDLKKYGTAFEDFIDGLIAVGRKKEPKRSLAVVRKRLSKK
ncbi:MAG: hypothetical protein Q9M14_02125 [Mariprofundaceae bacterium]|nr:hypothetical protein [Mariprofundaceae bacterium]